MNSGFFRYWGKAHASDQGVPLHLLAFHSLDVAAVGTVLLEQDRRLLPRIAALSACGAESLRRVLPFLLALHDLGKFSEPFQDLRSDLAERLHGSHRTEVTSSLRHDSLGYLLWRSWASLRADPREANLLPRLHQLSLPSGQLGRSDLAGVLQSWLAAVLGHHGRPPAEGNLAFDIFKAHPSAPMAASRSDAAAFALEAHALLAPGNLIATLDDLDVLEVRFRRASWWLAGFAILCDWIGSNTAYFSYETDPRPLAEYWETALARAHRAVQDSGLIGSAPRAFGGIGLLFPQIAKCPSQLQQAAATIELGDGPQLFVLEDLTGSGKTEAALILAQRLMSSGRADGIFFALPTMATANAMHSRVQPLIARLFEGNPNYLLTHSGPRLDEQDRLRIAGKKASDSYGRGAEVKDTASRTASEWLGDGRKKALLAELGVGTIDQALLAALQSKHAALRLMGLHHHVLVVDEVHACDAYMLGILCALLKLHAGLGGSAILLSATLPLQQRQKLAAAFAEGLGKKSPVLPISTAYPLLAGFDGSRSLEVPVAPREGCSRTLPIRFHREVKAVVGRLVEAARQGQCAVWVRNSVADALEAYQSVAAELGAEQVTLFHARFALFDRLKIEQRVVDCFGLDGTRQQRSGQVVVATQVVEQSLDIDFDVMVSDLAPIDLLIQRAGRLQRHRRLDLDRPAPALEVFAPTWSSEPGVGWLGGAFSRTARVYDDPAVLWRTAGELERRGKLVLPEDARSLVEAVHGEGASAAPPSLERRSIQAEGRTMSQTSVAQMATVRLDTGYLRTGNDWSSEARTPTRLGEPTITLRLARLDGPVPRAWNTDLPPHLHWPLSQLSLARRLVCAPAVEDEALRLQLEADQPFVGDDVVTVILRKTGADQWTGRAQAERTQGGAVSLVPVRLSYSEQRGLEVFRKE